MTFGIILSLFNHQFYKDKISIYNEFIPQVLFLESIFGYLVLCILYKWSVPWDNAPPPSLLNMLIDMFLSPGTIKPNGRLYAGQVDKNKTEWTDLIFDSGKRASCPPAHCPLLHPVDAPREALPSPQHAQQEEEPRLWKHPGGPYE